MFYSLNGVVSEILPNCIVLETAGIGFLINTSMKTISSATAGKPIKLYISEAIGETNFDLYGFSELQEKRFFEMLTTVSGVGPKAAISLLSALTSDQLLLAIVSDDAAALTAAPGIGKKLAQRIVLELRDKMGSELPSAVSSGTASAAPLPQQGSAVNEAVAALSVLGYSSADINPVLRARDWSGMSSEQIIREVLKSMI